MMFACDGRDIATMTCALLECGEHGCRVVREEIMPRVLGDELAVMLRFFENCGVNHSDILEIGAVPGPGSAGALRSVLSMVNAWALARGIEVQTLSYEQNVWSVVAAKKPFVLPVYERPAHTTPSQKDALGRKRV